jgi:hypothetical protein
VSENQTNLVAAKRNLSPLQDCVVFKDDPLAIGTDLESESDIFDHEAFAEAVLKLLKQNSPPLTIGIFGPWGIGKSTIINILFRKLRRNESKSFTPIYFNAWKYSGDSFRRQFLIEVAGQVYGKDSDEVSRLEQLNYGDVLKRSHQKGFFVSLAQVLRDTANIKFAFRGVALARFLIACMAVLVCVLASSIVSYYSTFTAVALMAIGVPAVFSWFASVKFEEVFAYQDAPIYDPKMIFPEQFEREFSLLMSKESLQGKKAVIAIDDIDRCEPAVVRDILISMKNFTGHQNCFLIVPCDDKSVVNVFSEPNQSRGYQDESLRKYFNVGIRIPPITSTDLIDFANNIARKTGIPNDVVQVAVLANCRDARKMKHFLNGLAMKYQIAKARETAGLMPPVVDANLAELAKAVLIEDAFPTLFARIVENPGVYEIIEREALAKTSAETGLKSLALSEDEKVESVALMEVLRRTRDIQMTHAAVLFSLKSTNQEARAPKGTELKNAIIDGNYQLVDEITGSIKESGGRTAVADLLLDVIKRSQGPFLQRAVSGSLRICFHTALFSSDDEARVAKACIAALLYHEGTPLLPQNPDQVIKSAIVAGEPYATEIFPRYLKELRDLSTPAPPLEIRGLVSAIYAYPEQRVPFASVFNEHFKTWVKTRDGLMALDSLVMPEGVLKSEIIPALPVLEIVLDSTTPEAVELENNVIRRRILYSNWSADFAEKFIGLLVKMLQGVPPGPTYGVAEKFVIESILLKPELAKTALAPQLWSLVSALYSRTTDAEGKSESAKAVMIFAALLDNPSHRTQARTLALGHLRGLSDAALREGMQFLATVDSPEAHQLRQAASEQELNLMRDERNMPTDRSSQRLAFCLDFAEYLNEESVQDVLLASIETNRTESLQKWLDAIRDQQERLGASFHAAAANRCLEVVRSTNPEQIRSEILLRGAVEALERLPVDRKFELTPSYLELLKDANANTRNAAAASLPFLRAHVVDLEDLRIRLGKLVGDLKRDISATDLPAYKPVFDAVMSQSDLFAESDWEEVAELAKRLMLEADYSLQMIGITMVERMPRIPDSNQSELIRILINIENAATQSSERAKETLSKIKQDTLSEDAKEALRTRESKEGNS